MLILPEELME